MGHSGLGRIHSHSLSPLHMGRHQRLLSDVVHPRVLDQLQCGRSSIMAHQGHNHRAWLDLWSTDMVAVFLHAVNQPYLDLGFKQEAVAYLGGIQHAVGVDILHGPSTASDINTDMSDRYLLPMARNTVTGQTVKTQDLTGTRFTLAQRRLAEDMADQCAAKMTARTGDLWQGFVAEYTPSYRR